MLEVPPAVIGPGQAFGSSYGLHFQLRPVEAASAALKQPLEQLMVLHRSDTILDPLQRRGKSSCSDENVLAHGAVRRNQADPGRGVDLNGKVSIIEKGQRHPVVSREPAGSLTSPIRQDLTTGKAYIGMLVKQCFDGGNPIGACANIVVHESHDRSAGSRNPAVSRM